MAKRFLTPSKITAWLDCAHYLTLRHEVDSGERGTPPPRFGEMAHMLVQKGLDHEQSVLDLYRSEGREVFEVSAREPREAFSHWVSRIGDVLGQGHDVVFQMPFVHAGICGIADFLEQIVDDDGTVTYEPVDAKLARNAAKPGHVLQLCFYAEAIAAQTGLEPEHVHIELGSGHRESIRVADVLAYWRRLRNQLAAVVAGPPTDLTRPEPYDHCGFCEFEQVCEAEWRSVDSLVHVAGVRRADRALLESNDIGTIAALAELDREIAGLDAVRRARMVRQASLQVQARNAPDGDSPPFKLFNALASYGLKHIEQLPNYERSHDIDRGAGAVVEYEHWMRDSDSARLDRIARYNEDDVRATRAVRDWLVDHRPENVEWRDAVVEPLLDDAELDARIEALHASAPGTHEYLMGDLLGYWRRERRVVAADCPRQSMANDDDQFESLSTVSRVSFERFEDRFSDKTGNKLKWPVAVFSFADQPLDPDIEAGSKMIVALTEQQWAFFSLATIERDSGTLKVSWNQAMIDQGVYPTSLVHFENYREGAKLTALADLADQILANDASAVGHALLRNDAPRFLANEGPHGNVFANGYWSICEWAPHLDRGFVPIQGPPGTGKTFTGAHIIRTCRDGAAVDPCRARRLFDRVTRGGGARCFHDRRPDRHGLD